MLEASGASLIAARSPLRERCVIMC
jgi:hypothetical protein